MIEDDPLGSPLPIAQKDDGDGAPVFRALLYINTIELWGLIVS
jgi:hypothetical protein